jgi:predicted nucleic acid-binding protein
MEREPRRVCLDTDIVIDYLKQTGETEELVEKLYLRFDEIALTAITVYELLLGTVE